MAYSTRKEGGTPDALHSHHKSELLLDCIQRKDLYARLFLSNLPLVTTVLDVPHHFQFIEIRVGTKDLHRQNSRGVIPGKLWPPSQGSLCVCHSVVPHSRKRLSEL